LISPIGTLAPPTDANSALARARLRAALVPDLLIEAQRISNTVAAGGHGRRRRGIGDSFWQFRPYDTGESLSRIDWRRSARDGAVTVRDQEWEAAHTVWIWADNSPSMHYKSSLSDVSKQSRALVLALALAEILARSGERVGWPGLTRALSTRKSAERIAAEMLVTEGQMETSFPPTEHMSKRSELIIISDFLDPIETLEKQILKTAQRGVRGTLIQIIDPAETEFPFSGRTEFTDPENGRKFTAGRAERLTQDYQALFSARNGFLGDHCKRLGWHHIVHQTDQLASTCLVTAHTRLSGQIGGAI